MIKLLGKQSQFLIEEEKLQGDTIIFRALWNECIRNIMNQEATENSGMDPPS